MSKAKYVSMWVLGAIILIALLCCRAWPDWLLYGFGIACYIGLWVVAILGIKHIIKILW